MGSLRPLPCFLLAALLPAWVFAQTEAPAPILVAPQLVRAAEATYPAEAQAEHQEGTVVLRLTIAATGHVTAAETVEPAGHGFDEAAQEAALRFQFTPASRNGQPVPARVLYPLTFRLPTPEPAPAAPAPVVVAVPVKTPPAAVEEVSVRGVSEAQRLQQSAEAVLVVDTRRAKQQTADLGEVLARTQGVAVRREGGLGSGTRFALNGLYDDQVRFFLDGVPLELAGYPFDPSNVPVNLLERIEIYRGVVPIRFGADALGGALNLVSVPNDHNRLSASYQVGSFGTHRLTLDGHYRPASSGWSLRGAGFFDTTRNDYRIDVEIPNEQGQLLPATVRRFHDGYRALGGHLELGLANRRWAKRLSLKAFASAYEKELQHNIVMTVPYGEVAYGERVYGGTANYDVELRAGLDLSLVANYSRRTIDYQDLSPFVYDWRGQRIRDRPQPGEINGDANDVILWQNSVFARSTLRWALSDQHSLTLSLTPTASSRTGANLLREDPTRRDPLSAKSDLFTWVSGLEYESHFFNDRLSNIVFVKDYLYRAESVERVSETDTRRHKTQRHTQGAGDMLRFRFTPWLYAKASYEYATRLPRPDEVFGNGVRIMENLELQPETSHNANLGPRLELSRTRVGDFIVDINGFVRESQKLIVLLGNEQLFSYQNVYQSRGLGLENSVNWTSPSRLLNLYGTLSWQESRNASNDGTFRNFKGDRIPNRPYLFGSWGGRLRIAGLPSPEDTLEPFYVGRYVHSFFRGWGSLGLRTFKQQVDSQLTHSAGVTWNGLTELARGSATLELDNLTDAHVYDNFGVQRPGRALYFKLTGEI